MTVKFKVDCAGVKLRVTLWLSVLERYLVRKGSARVAGAVAFAAPVGLLTTSVVSGDR